MNPLLFLSPQHQVKESDRSIHEMQPSSPPSPCPPPVFASSSVLPTAEAPKRISMVFQTIPPQTRHKSLTKSQRKALRKYYETVPQGPSPEWRIFNTYTDLVHPSHPEMVPVSKKKHNLSPLLRGPPTPSSS